MTVGKFMEYCWTSSHQLVIIFDMSFAKVVWTGMGDEIPDEYESIELGCFETSEDGALYLNIN